MKRLFLLLCLLGLAACSGLPPPQQARISPLLESAGLHSGMQRLIVVVPGAFDSVNIYAPVQDWDLPDTGMIAYRFPAIDGMSADHRVDMALSAQLIADRVNALAPREVWLIGYSTGGPIAIETTKRLAAPQLRLALISSAADSPAGLLASARGAREMVVSMLRSGGGLGTETLLENYRALLYGRDYLRQAETAERSQQQAEAVRATMMRPSLRLTLAHSASLLTWRLDRPDASRDGLARARIAFFHGGADPLFTVPQMLRFAGRLHADRFWIYEGQGHLLYATSGRLFGDIRSFFLQGDIAD